MSRPFQVQLAVFALVVGLGVGLVGWTGYTAWSHLAFLRQQYGAVQIESFQFAEYVKATVLTLNESLLRFDARENPADRDRFETESRALRTWMATNKAHLHTPLERELMDQIEDAFNGYLAIAGKLVAEAGQKPGLDPVIFHRTEGETARLLELCGRLAAAHRTALGGVVADSHRRMVQLQRLTLVALGLLVVVGASLAVLVYRGMIAPLRTQLTESRAVIERQEKLSALGMLGAGVAHEIRNPLTAIKVRLHGLTRSVRGDASASEDAAVIGDEIARLERIVNDFLQFARPSDPHFVVTTAERILKELHELMKHECEKKRVDLKFGPLAAGQVRADLQQIKQVLINLVQNAAESIEPPGCVTLQARAAEIPLAGRNTAVMVMEVQDSGRGIPPEIEKRLFDPFFTTKEGGTGLGLSIAARIVEKHGGALHYQTQLKRGTTFGVILPRVENDET